MKHLRQIKKAQKALFEIVCAETDRCGECILYMPENQGKTRCLEVYINHIVEKAEKKMEEQT